MRLHFINDCFFFNCYYASATIAVSIFFFFEEVWCRLKNTWLCGARICRQEPRWSPIWEPATTTVLDFSTHYSDCGQPPRHTKPDDNFYNKQFSGFSANQKCCKLTVDFVWRRSLCGSCTSLFRHR